MHETSRLHEKAINRQKKTKTFSKHQSLAHFITADPDFMEYR